jgi:hypothetical protein
MAAESANPTPRSFIFVTVTGTPPVELKKDHSTTAIATWHLFAPVTCLASPGGCVIFATLDAPLAKLTQQFKAKTRLDVFLTQGRDIDFRLKFFIS